MTQADFLRYHRKKAGFTQKSLATALGTRQETIKFWETSRTIPAHWINRLHKVLGINRTILVNIIVDSMRLKLLTKIKTEDLDLPQNNPCPKADPSL